MINKKAVLPLAAAAAASVLIIWAVIAPNVNKAAPKGVNSGSLPVFMYFVTDTDMSDKSVSDTLSRLEKEYVGKVEFDVRNVDKDTKLLSDFPVKDNTPALIMLDENGDIDGFFYQTSDYDKLKNAIDGTLNKPEKTE